MPPLDIWKPGNILSPLWHQAVAWMDKYILEKLYQNVLKPHQWRIHIMNPYFLSSICLIIIILLEHLKQSCRYMSEYSPYCLCIKSMWSDDIWNPGNGLSTLWHQAVAWLVNTLRPRQNGRHFPDDFSNGFSWMKMYEFRLTFHWSLFQEVQLTIFQHRFR